MISANSHQLAAIVGAMLVIAGNLIARPVYAEKNPAQRWSGYIEYERTASTDGSRDSTWMHATALGTPTSHSTSKVSETMSAVFVVTRGETNVPVDITYSQGMKSDKVSKARVVCRDKNGKHTAGLNRSHSESTSLSAAVHLPNGGMSVGGNVTAGEYSVTVSAGDFEAKGSAMVLDSENTGCAPKPSKNQTDLPPFTTTVSGFSARGIGHVDPDKPNVLSGTYRISDSETLTWNLSAEKDEPPLARHGPYESLRGDAVTFDGSRSKGKELAYKWTFKGGSCSDDPTVREVTLEGPVVTATLLCNTDVSLEVTDNEGRKDKRTKTAKVRPREWNAEVRDGEEMYFRDDTHMVHGLAHFAPGANRCANHDDRELGRHYLHPGRGKWEGEIYTLKEVKDGGPFDGMFYLDLVANPVPVVRSKWFNIDLQPTSRLAKENAKTPKTAQDFNTLVEQVQAHEEMHNTLLEEAVGKLDSLKAAEFQVAGSRDELREKATTAFGYVETDLAAAGTNEQEIKTRLKKNGKFNRSGMIRIPVGSADSGEFGDWQIANFAELGDE